MAIPAIGAVAAGATFLLSVQSLVDQLADGAAYVTGERQPTLDEIQRLAHAYEGPLAEWAAGAVFEAMGLQLDTSEGITGQAITRAINAGPLAGLGFELTNVFDADACRADFMRYGVSKACEALGVSSESIGGLRDAVRASVLQDVREQLTAGAGDLLDGAPDAERVARIIAAVPPGSGWNEPRDFSAAGVSNRERQRRFRAQSPRHWEER